MYLCVIVLVIAETCRALLLTIPCAVSFLYDGETTRSVREYIRFLCRSTSNIRRRNRFPENRNEERYSVDWKAGQCVLFLLLRSLTRRCHVVAIVRNQRQCPLSPDCIGESGDILRGNDGLLCSGRVGLRRHDWGRKNKRPPCPALWSSMNMIFCESTNRLFLGDTPSTHQPDSLATDPQCLGT